MRMGLEAKPEYIMNEPLQRTLTMGLHVVVAATLSQPAAAQSTLVKTTVCYRKVVGHEILADVYRPKGDEVRPVIVSIHGGALIMGNREGIHAEIRALAEAKGFALVSLDYRLAPETKLPDLISDIEAAFHWLAGDGAKRFYLDPDRVVVTGGSAGGYLTLVTGYRVQPRPKALVAMYGYGHVMRDWYATPSPHARHNRQKVSRDEALRKTDGTIISDDRRRQRNGGMIYSHYRQNGIWPHEVSGFDEATIAEQIRPFEPARNVTAGYPPTLLIHGAVDTDVPYDESALMAEQLERHHVPVILKTIDNGEHGFGGGNSEQIQEAYKTMREFIVNNLTD